MKLEEVPCASCEFDETEERYCLLCPVLREKREWRKSVRRDPVTVNLNEENYND